MLGITVTRGDPTPLFRQVYIRLRDLILEGRITAGERLPSTRELATVLGVSRNVVLEAYGLLTAEGYLEGRQGSGTRVAAGASLGRLGGKPPAPSRTPAWRPAHMPAGIPSGILAGHPPGNPPPPAADAPKDLIDFRSGIPAVDVFPLKKWGRLVHEVCLDAPGSLLMYDRPEGRPELRRALAGYLFRARGLMCNPNRLLITTGATQGLALVAKLLYLPDAAAVVEDPVNIGMQRIFAGAGYRFIPVPVDAHGLDTALLPADASPRFVYVTPSHQFPLGGILPVQRRIELIAYARDKDCFIVEDDYDSEFRHEGPPLSTLHSLDPERVIYAGSFSKVLAPALRLGYVILPPELMVRCRELKRYADIHTPSLDQLALARLIDDGRLERHINRMKRVYAARRRATKEALGRHFPGAHTVSGDSTGLHLVVEFPGVDFTEELLARLEQEGVRVYPVERHALEKGRHRHKVILGYGHLEPERIAAGVQRLHRGLSVT
ncbi:MAG: PLP-dependent aminotransferase family protein [Bacillota bacterium]